MRVAVLGCHKIPDIARYLPDGITSLQILAGRGINPSVNAYARAHNIPVKVYRPDPTAPKRESSPYVLSVKDECTLQIIHEADHVVIFWARSYPIEMAFDAARNCGKPICYYKFL